MTTHHVGGGIPVDVSARFRAPAYVRNVVDRRRLLELLQGTGRRQLLVIHAPAGYGKTTLAVQWLDALERDGALVAWLGLHDDDNAPHWFVSHLVEAARQALPPSPDLVARLHDHIEQASDDVYARVVSVLLEWVAGQDQRLVLTLDDWHVISDEQVHRMVVQLLDFAPPQLSLVITSRTRPALPLSRFRVRQQLTEIDADLLRFAPDEAAEFLVEVNGLTLDWAQIESLTASTDGWVAALQLASLSLRDSNDPGALIRGFSGRHHSIGDYLAENVLAALRREDLEFLLRTSICDRLCGDLAGLLADRPNGQGMLEELERRDLFLRPLDTERRWFRYHQLFADYLRRRLERDDRGRVPELHRVAARWFSDQDLVSEAVGHALAAGDEGRATDLVERHAMPLLERSLMVSVLGLADRLPEHSVRSRPGLLTALAWANCLLRRSDAAQAAVNDLRSGDVDRSGETDTETDVIQACIDVYNDRIDRAETLVARSLEVPGAVRPFVVAVAANIQSFCDIHTMRYADARERQAWVRPLHERIGPFAAVYGRCFAGMAALAQLDVPAAQAHIEEAVAMARSRAGRVSHAAHLAGALLGELCYERGEIDAAETLLEESRDLGPESGVVDFMVASYVLLARIRNQRGEQRAAAELLAEGGTVARRLGLPRLLVSVEAERVRQLLSARRPVDARRAAQNLPDGSGCHLGVAVDQIRTLALAAVQSAEGDHDSAVALLDQMIDELRERGQVRCEVSASVQRAVVLERAARSLSAERGLAGVLGRIVDAGTRQILIDGGAEVRTILRRLSERLGDGRWPEGSDPLEPAAVTELLAWVEERHTSAAAPALLNEREANILRMLDEGRTNKQIGDVLNITVNTVKWHLKNISAKLGASNRAEAVSLARRCGLLS